MLALLRSLALASLVVFSARAVTADVLSPDEHKWVRACMERLDSNSPRVRKSAETALVNMGREIIPAVVANLRRIKGATAESGLLRVMMGIGRGAVLQDLTSMARDARPAERKRIEAFMDRLGVTLGVGEPLQVGLTTARLLSGDTVPHNAEHALRGGWPRALLPSGGTAQPKGEKLAFTPQGGETTLITKGKPAVVSIRVGARTLDVLVYDKVGAWFAASASLRTGTVRKLDVAFWDTDLDGRFDGPKDMARIAPGTWQLTRAGKLAYEDHVLSAKLNLVGDALHASLVVDPAPKARATEQLRFLRALHRWRALHGLGPLTYDAQRSLACMEHSNYLVLNNNNPEAVDGGASHIQIKGLPGATDAGAGAGFNSVLYRSGLDGMVRRNAITMLHRVAWLAPSGSAVGIGSARQGRAAWSAVWSDRAGPATDPRLVTVPAPGARRVPRAGGTEWPPPDVPADWYGGRRGYPISVTYTHLGVRTPKLTVFRADADGVPGDAVAGHTWSPEKPIAASHRSNRDTVFFMAARPLESESTYWAVFEGQGGSGPVRFVWTFQSR